MLKALHHETDFEDFEATLRRFVEFLGKKKLLKFIEYFRKYSNTSGRYPAAKWSYCFRRGITTNNYIESFHNVFKKKYLNGRIGARVDNCLYGMLNYSRDILFTQAHKVLKNGYTGPEKRDMDAHEKAKSMADHLTVKDDNNWSVRSETQPGVNYLVSRRLEECSCRIRCRSCKICPHLYICECVDNMTRGNSICKHIHVVGISLRLSSEPEHILQPQDTLAKLEERLEAEPETTTYPRAEMLMDEFE